MIAFSNAVIGLVSSILLKDLSFLLLLHYRIPIVIEVLAHVYLNGWLLIHDFNIIIYVLIYLLSLLNLNFRLMLSCTVFKRSVAFEV